MMFQKGDLVSYGMDGIYRIEKIARMCFYGASEDYFVLRSNGNPDSTIFVPVNNENLKKKMRRILSPDEIYALIHAMPEQKSIWIEDENERKEKYREILARGDRSELVRVIKTLYLHRQKQNESGKKLHLSDEHFFKEAERILYEEFALVLKIRPEQVLPFILEQIGIDAKEEPSAFE